MMWIRLVFTLLIIPSIAFASPFGIEQGQSMSDFKIVDRLSEFKYMIKDPPRPHPKFVHYGVWGTPETGVCAVVGLGELHKNDGYGKSVRKDFKNVKRALDKKYGKGTKYQHFASDGIWDDPGDWVMAIKQNERTHLAHWADPSAKNIQQISLSIRAYSSTASQIKISYQLLNFDKCKRIIQEKADSAL